MSTQKVSELMSGAQQELGEKLAIRINKLHHQRYVDTMPFLVAVHEFDRCRFWQDGGYASLAEWATANVWNSFPREWDGWSALARIPDQYEIAGWVQDKKLHPEDVALLTKILTPYNWRSLLTLVVVLKPAELRKAVRAYGRLAHTGYEGDVVFVPLWLPRETYGRVFNGNVEARPWDQIQTYFKGAAKDR